MSRPSRKTPRPEPRSHLALYRELPAPISHATSVEGAVSTWEEIQSIATDPRVLKGLPDFVSTLVRVFMNEDAEKALWAMRNGDCAFFVAWQMRLDQIDCAIVANGGGIGGRAPIIRAKFMVQGFLDAAKERLEGRGGKWPPAALPV